MFEEVTGLLQNHWDFYLSFYFLIMFPFSRSKAFGSRGNNIEDALVRS